MSARAGFAVIYQWRVKAGRLHDFFTAWGEVTDALKRERGALGSRLHRTDQGTWMAYSQWPDRAAWERACREPPVAAAAAERLRDAVEDTWPPLLMTTQDDRLV
jgi:quinol monooxygenase YgiN